MNLLWEANLVNFQEISSGAISRYTDIPGETDMKESTLDLVQRMVDQLTPLDQVRLVVGDDLTERKYRGI